MMTQLRSRVLAPIKRLSSACVCESWLPHWSWLESLTKLGGLQFVWSKPRSVIAA
jgi:hypothetical protein